MMGLDGAKGPGSGQCQECQGSAQGSARAMDSWCGGWETTNAALSVRRWITGSVDRRTPVRRGQAQQNEVAGEADAAS
ncbi:hypothetical protein E4U15_005744 [Claviceps sp. LM218 group G6]|nr:hypothetical protein E4U15_005744 [Claviceps sp. LM218 group G6]